MRIADFAPGVCLVILFSFLAVSTVAASRDPVGIVDAYWQVDDHDWQARRQLMKEILAGVKADSADAPLWTSFALWQIEELEKRRGWGGDYPSIPAEESFKPLMRDYPESLPAKIVQYEIAYDLMQRGRIHEACAQFRKMSDLLPSFQLLLPGFHVLAGHDHDAAPPAPGLSADIAEESGVFLANVDFFGAYTCHEDGDQSAAADFLAKLDRAVPKPVRDSAGSSFAIVFDRRPVLGSAGSRFGWHLADVHGWVKYRGQLYGDLKEPIADLRLRIGGLDDRAPSLIELYREAISSADDGKSLRYIEALIRQAKSRTADDSQFVWNAPAVLERMNRRAGGPADRRRVAALGRALVEVCPYPSLTATILVASGNYAAAEEQLVASERASLDELKKSFLLRGRIVLQQSGRLAQARFFSRELPRYTRLMRSRMRPGPSEASGRYLGYIVLATAHAWEEVPDLGRAMQTYADGISALPVDEFTLSMRYYLAERDLASGRFADARRLFEEISESSIGGSSHLVSVGDRLSDWALDTPTRSLAERARARLSGASRARR